MLAKVNACAVIGLDGIIVDVEVDYGHGMPRMSIVGLPDAAVQESKERVFSAIKNANPVNHSRRFLSSTPLLPNTI